jgi:16S rRNA C1402 (ribose-2'-O) methylase RsmI
MKSYETRKTRSLLALYDITNRDVAREARVSETFVSYVINGKRKSAHVQQIITNMVVKKTPS